MSFLTAPQVRQRFGGITNMTLWRWARDARVGFPHPVVINGRRYYRESEIEAFEARKVAETPTEKPVVETATELTIG